MYLDSADQTQELDTRQKVHTFSLQMVEEEIPLDSV